MKSGKLTPKLTKIKPSEIPDGILLLEQGKVQGRLVACYEE